MNYGEKNNLKVSEEEVKTEIQKQIKGMPGQEKMVIEYYQKNPSASQSLKVLYMKKKLLILLNQKLILKPKRLTLKEAEKIISDFNKPNIVKKDKLQN